MSSWFGDSVGHYEGDTLVIDTVGIKTGPFTMVGQFGTPHTPALHVIDPGQLNTYDVLVRDRVVFTKPAFESFVARVEAGAQEGGDR